MCRSWVDLAAAAFLLGSAALRAERRSARGEAPLVGLASIVFLAHLAAAGRDFRQALGPAAVVALRLLALLYLLRWAARRALGRVARWLMGFRPPARPRFLLLLSESARLTAALLPLALREAEQHVTALRARGIRVGRGLRGRARYLLAWFFPFLGTMLRVTGARVRIAGAGRTDSGCHAAGQVASATLNTRLTPERLRAALNAHLPPDIRIVEAAEAEPRFHARYRAMRRAYRYLIVPQPSA